ncbi:MAG: hypothetical protein ACREQ5_11285, partial [Candidatus Dormibacteria bacterium]
MSRSLSEHGASRAARRTPQTGVTPVVERSVWVTQPHGTGAPAPRERGRQRRALRQRQARRACAV